MSSLRVFFIGGYIAYRALFNWARPAIYIPTMLGAPLFQLLFFAYIGRYTGLEDDAFFVVGNAVQLSAMAGIYGMAMTIGGERWTGTLSPLLATPARRLPLFIGRSLPLIANGILVSAFAFFVGWLLLDFTMSASQIPALTLVVIISAASCTCLGMVVGSLGLRARDVFFLANTVVFLLLIVSGANVPLDALPGWLQTIAYCVPLTHGILAARDIAGGASLSDVAGLVWREAAIGAAYALVAYVLLRFFEADGRRRATLETI
jgi:ABC-2 type transport system permease protein